MTACQHFKKPFYYFLRTSICLILVFSFHLSFGQSDKVLSGTVLDAGGNPIEGVIVKVPLSNVRTTTDKKGAFLLNVPASAERIAFSKKGLQYQQVTIGNKSSFTIKMQPFSSFDPEDEDGENAGNPSAAKGPHTVTGMVTDEKDAPVAKVSITVKGSNNGTTTDDNGAFMLVLPAGRNTLLVSSVGIEPKEVVVGRNQASLSITVNATSLNLNEVVVVGYNTQKKVNLTGAVSSVDFTKVKNVPQANTLNILQGRVPGVSIVQPGGQPGQDQGDISIRGIGTLNDANPLVVIDGVQSTLTDFGNLNPQEIANVSVLKDASSAAIYGTRGANGVILVTTKDPGKRKLQINLNSYYGWQKATYLPQFVDSYQWMELQNEAAGTIYDSLTIEKLKAGNYSDSLVNTHWPQELFRTAPMSNYNLSINGGSQAVSYQASLGYLQQDGIMPNTGTKRYNFRTNVRAQINNKVESGLNVWGYVQNNHEPFSGTNNILTGMNQAYPYVPVKTSTGNWGVYAYADGRITRNPLLETTIGRNDQENFKGSAQAYLQYKPFKDLRIKTMASYSYLNLYEEDFKPTYSYPDLAGVPVFTNFNNNLINRESQDKQYQLQTTAIYNKIFAQKHAVTLLAGHEFVSFKSRFFRAEGTNLPANDQQVLNNAVNNYNVRGQKQEWATQSFFGRANYVFNDKYLLEASFRADGSSRFPEGNKYGYFPSFSAGWIISREKFFDPLANTFTLFKVRGGYGSTGNDRIGNYTFQQFIDLNGFYGTQPAGSITEYANPDIRWEQTITTNVGLDLGVFKNKLLVNFDVFNRLTKDILFKLPLPSSFGNVAPPVQNIGEVSNKGWELNMEHRNTLGKNFTYNLGLNVAYVKNRIEKLNAQESIYGSDRFILREGEAINSFYGYQFLGLFRDSADFLKYPAYSQTGLRLGTSILKDVNGDSLITADDRMILGSANTPYTYGISGGVTYKNFDLSFLFQGVYGKKIFIMDFGNRPGNAGNTNFWKEWYVNRYQPTKNPDGEWPVLKRNAPEVGQVLNSFFLRDASYLRLKNLEMGYTISPKLSEKLKIRNARFYVSGQNILTFTKLIHQIDPERNATTVANNTFPQVKILTVGFNVGF